MEHLENRKLNLCNVDRVFCHEVTPFQARAPSSPMRAMHWSATAFVLDVANPLMQCRRPTRADRVAVLRATHTLARKYPNRFVLIGGKGRKPLWLNRGIPSLTHHVRLTKIKTRKPRLAYTIIA